jgi:hypothetical protein
MTTTDFDYDEWSQLTEDQKYHRLLAEAKTDEDRAELRRLKMMTPEEREEEAAEIKAEILRGAAPDELQLAIMRVMVSMSTDDPKQFSNIMKLQGLTPEEAEAFVKRCRKMAWS